MEKLLNTFKVKQNEPLTTVFQIPIFISKIIGIWPRIDKYPMHLYKLYGILMFCCLILTHTLCQAATILFVYNDLDLLFGTIYILLTDAVVCFKAIVYLTNRDLYESIINELNSEIFLPKNERQTGILQKFMTTWRNMFMVYESTGISTVALWILYPLLNEELRVNRTLPFIAWYPFDTKQSPVFELIYCHQMLSIQYLVFLNVMGDGILGGIMIYCAGLCAVLNDNLRNIYDVAKEKLIRNGTIIDDASEDDKEKIYQEYNRTFVDLINYHRALVKFAEHTNLLSDRISICQFAATLPTLCITMYRLSTVSPVSPEFYTLFSFQIAICLQISMFCILGDFIIVESKLIPDSIYASDWYNAPISFRKSMSIFMFCTTRPIEFRALRFFVLSIDTFGKILRSAWSYFSVLRQHNQNKN